MTKEDSGSSDNSPLETPTKIGAHLKGKKYKIMKDLLLKEIGSLRSMLLVGLRNIFAQVDKLQELVWYDMEP